MMKLQKKMKEIREKKRNNQGFTLVELIVVLVVLAILMAVLIPALLGYIDKAREKQLTTNANAALVAAQAIADEAYGKTQASANITNDTPITTGPISTMSTSTIASLTDIQYKSDAVPQYQLTYQKVYGSDSTKDETKGKEAYKIATFTYKEGSKTATWTSSTGNWTVTG